MLNWRFPEEKFPALTGIRAVAAYLVFFHHYTPPADIVTAPVAGLLTEGHIGVTLFYVLSGFLITYNYAAKAREGGRRFWVQYFGRRIARIYPLYLFLLMVTFVASTTPPDALTAFLNATLLKGFFGDYYFTGIPQAWSLTVEETFYLLAPLLFSLTLRYGYLATLLLFYLIGGALMSVGGHNVFYSFFSDYQFTILYTFVGRAFEFLSGMALARMVMRDPDRLKAPAYRLLAYAGAAGCILTLAGLAFFRGGIYKFGLFHPAGMALNNLLLPLFVCMWLAGMLAGPTLLSRLLASPPMVFLGRASYSFYLVHFGVLAAFASQYVTNDLWRPFRLFAVLNVIAAALYLLVEHPYNRMLRQWLASLEEAIAPAAGRSTDSAAPAVRNAAKQAAARR